MAEAAVSSDEEVEAASAVSATKNDTKTAPTTDEEAKGNPLQTRGVRCVHGRRGDRYALSRHNVFVKLRSNSICEYLK